MSVTLLFAPDIGIHMYVPFIFRLNPVMNKSQAKVIDKTNPVIRSAVRSPEKPIIPEGPRAGTAHSALSHPPQLSRLRKGGLPNVQLLPSKNKISKWWRKFKGYMYRSIICTEKCCCHFVSQSGLCQWQCNDQ